METILWKTQRQELEVAKRDNSVNVCYVKGNQENARKWSKKCDQQNIFLFTCGRKEMIT